MGIGETNTSLHYAGETGKEGFQLCQMHAKKGTDRASSRPKWIGSGAYRPSVAHLRARASINAVTPLPSYLSLVPSIPSIPTYPSSVLVIPSLSGYGISYGPSYGTLDICDFKALFSSLFGVITLYGIYIPPSCPTLTHPTPPDYNTPGECLDQIRITHPGELQHPDIRTYPHLYVLISYRSLTLYLSIIKRHVLIYILGMVELYLIQYINTPELGKLQI